MKVRCETNIGKDLPDLYLDPAGGFTEGKRFPLERGKEYIVFGLTLRRGGIWYYVLDENRLDYPVWYPGPLFDVSDPRISRYWIFGFAAGGIRDGDAVFAFPDWARNPYDYYDRLTDGESSAKATFLEYRELMTLEFRNDGVQSVAEDLGDGWFLCPECKDAWRDPLRGEMMRCPSCRKLLLNPALLSES